MKLTLADVERHKTARSRWYVVYVMKHKTKRNGIGTCHATKTKREAQEFEQQLRDETSDEWELQTRIDRPMNRSKNENREN